MSEQFDNALHDLFERTAATPRPAWGSPCRC